jgi:hypothetical protein
MNAKVVTCLFVCFGIVSVALAERKEKPSGQEIAQKAKSAKLVQEKAVTGQKKGKKIKITPADQSNLKEEDVENGVVVAQMEGDLAGDETNLPAGKHNVFLCKVNGEWKAYAESGGQIVAEAKSVKMQKVERRNANPQAPSVEFKEEGWFWVLEWQLANTGVNALYTYIFSFFW